MVMVVSLERLSSPGNGVHDVPHNVEDDVVYDALCGERLRVECYTCQGVNAQWSHIVRRGGGGRNDSMKNKRYPAELSAGYSVYVALVSLRCRYSPGRDTCHEGSHGHRQQ